MRSFLAIPTAAVGLYLLLRLILPAASVPLLGQVAVALSSAGAAAACIAAALAFRPGDYLRRAWLVGVAAYAANVLSMWFLPEPGAPTAAGLLALDAGFALLTNALAVVGIWLFGNAYRASGLAPPQTVWRGALTALCALALAAPLAGVPFVLGARDAWNGDAVALIRAIGSGGDVLIAVVLAPVFLLVLAFRGGLLVWPWSFFLAGNVCWLFYDAQGALAAHTPGAAWLSSWLDLWAIAATSLTSAAALVQRRIVRGGQG